MMPTAAAATASATVDATVAFDALPVEMIAAVAERCGVDTVRALCAVNARVRAAASASCVWRSLYARDYPPCAEGVDCLARVGDGTLTRVDDGAATVITAAKAARVLMAYDPCARCRHHHPPSLVEAHGWRWAYDSNALGARRASAALRLCGRSGHDASSLFAYRGAPLVSQRARGTVDVGDGVTDRPTDAGIITALTASSVSLCWGTWYGCIGDGYGTCLLRETDAPARLFVGRLVGGRPRGSGRMWLSDGAFIEAAWTTRLGSPRWPLPAGDGRLVTRDGDVVECVWAGHAPPRVTGVVLADGTRIRARGGWCSTILGVSAIRAEDGAATATSTQMAGSMHRPLATAAQLAFWPVDRGALDSPDADLLVACLRGGRFFNVQAAGPFLPLRLRRRYASTDA